METGEGALMTLCEWCPRSAIGINTVVRDRHDTIGLETNTLNHVLIGTKVAVPGGAKYQLDSSLEVVNLLKF